MSTQFVVIKLFASAEINMQKTFISILVTILISCSLCDNNLTDKENNTLIDEEAVPKKILFIGSSYFDYNNLPEMFSDLALACGKEVIIDSRVDPGTYLSDHANMQETEDLIGQNDWDYVVLQGVGPLMAYPDYFTEHPVAPAIRALKQKIYLNSNLTKIVFCLPWAFEDGMTWYKDWTDTFADMQIKINDTTHEYANNISFNIAPVGVAWHTILEEKNYPLHYLHLNDWNHPSLKGSYLMANVIYSTIFIESTLESSYYAGLSKEEAQHFQTIASSIVMENLDLWLK